MRGTIIKSALAALFLFQVAVHGAPVTDTGSASSETQTGASGPEEAVQAMHEALCAGDFQAFDNVVDLDRAFVDIASAEVADQNHLSTQEKERRIRFLISQIKRELKNSLATEDYSINCKAQAVLQSQDGDKARVISRLPTRKDRFVLVEKHNGRWTIVSLETKRSVNDGVQAASSGGTDTTSNHPKTSLGNDVAGPTWGADPDGPLETARRIQEAACAGDDNEFMRFMDTNAVIDNSMERIMQKKGIGENSDAHRMLQSRKGEMARALERKIRSQIREGRGGGDCHYNLRMIESDGRNAVVEIQLDGGRPSHVFMERRKTGLWVIINLIRPDQDEDVENSDHYVIRWTTGVALG